MSAEQQSQNMLTQFLNKTIKKVTCINSSAIHLGENAEINGGCCILQRPSAKRRGEAHDYKAAVIREQGNAYR